MEPTKLNVTNKEKVKSINHALKTLNEAANESAEEIRGMLRKDYSRLTEVFSDVKPQVESSFREMRDEVVTTAKQTVDKVDETVHRSPWAFIGGAAAISILMGFLLGRKSKS